MRTTIRTTIDQFTRVPGALVADASDLGIGPGVWPQAIYVANERGAVEMFLRCRTLLGDEGGWVYASHYTPTELHIIND